MFSLASNFISNQGPLGSNSFTSAITSNQFNNDSYADSTKLYDENNNGTFPDYPEIPNYIKITSIFFCVFIMMLGVIGNVMVPIVILKTKDMRNSTNIFLVNLSVADLLVLLVCTPTVLVEVNSKPETWLLGKELCLAVPFVELTVAHASVLTILAISFERYYAICEPLRAGYVCTKTRATLICFLTWFFAAVFTSPILSIAEYKYSPDRKADICLTQAVHFFPWIFFITTITIFYFIPLLMLVVLYSIIAKNLVISTSNVKDIVDPLNSRARKQVILMLGTVVLSFFVCLMPFRLFSLWVIISDLSSTTTETYYILLYFSRVMFYLNSAINPILYNLMSSKFRKGFKRLWRIKSRAKTVAKWRPRAATLNTVTVSSSCTTSSSITRTTNSLRQLFSQKSSLEKKEDIVEKRKRRYLRQQSDPSNNRTANEASVKRVRSVDNVFAESANSEVDYVQITMRKKVLLNQNRRHSSCIFIEDVKIEKFSKKSLSKQESFV